MLYELWKWMWRRVLSIAPKDVFIGCSDECQYEKAIALAEYWAANADHYKGEFHKAEDAARSLCDALEIPHD